MKKSSIVLLCLALALPLAAEASITKIRNDATPGAHARGTSMSNGYTYFANEDERNGKTQISYSHRGHYYEAPVFKFASKLDVQEKTFIFDPSQGGYAAYDENGALVKTGIASGGAAWCKDIGHSCRTAVGSFRVYRKAGAECKSSKFPIRRSGANGGAPMPHCMFFHNGLAVHGSYEIPNYNASHGCVRIKPEDARWLNQNFMNVGTKVIIKPYAS